MRTVKILFILCMPLILFSCGVQKTGVMDRKEQISSTEGVVETSDNLEKSFGVDHLPEEGPLEEESRPILRIDSAIEFLGAPYKYGGNSYNGMDCSGLVQTAFLNDEIRLPRTSREMAQMGRSINLEEVSSGDLLFFTTSSRHNNINHVGLVTEVSDQGIFFIHSTTSRGVIISSLEERFWKKAMVMARRIN